MTGRPLKRRSPDVLRAIRRLGDNPSRMASQMAVFVIASALEGGVTIPSSTVLALGPRVLDPNAQLDRATRIRAATVLSAVRKREKAAKAIQMICRDDTPRDALQAAAAILLGTPCRRLSKTTTRALTRHIRRYGQIRGPMVDLLRLSVPAASRPSKDKQ